MDLSLTECKGKINTAKAICKPPVVVFYFHFWSADWDTEAGKLYDRNISKTFTETFLKVCSKVTHGRSSTVSFIYTLFSLAIFLSAVSSAKV